MNKTLLALLLTPALMAQTAIAADQNRAISYLTSWGLADGDATRLEKSKIDTFLLSFGKWDAEGNIETSDGIASKPEYNGWWMPTAYITWTQLKHAEPGKKMMVAFGGQTYETIWEDINTPEKREIVANGLANLLKQPFPVYKKNLKESEMIGGCLNWNWNGSECDMTTFQQAGTVYLDGIDFDFEKAARLTEKENDDLLQLATRVRQLIGKDKLLSLTTYHVGADPVNCADSSVLENCSYIETKRSTHHGEVLPLLQQSKDIFDFFNVMAYDAGPDFLWKTAMNNYGNAVGDKSKVVLGTTINEQWGPNNNFVESKENNLERARWQKQQGFGGFFTWTVGANTENLSVTEQVDYINEMKSAADAAQIDESADILLSSVVVHPDKNKITVMMPEEIYSGKNNVVLYINGKNIAQSYNGTRYYSHRPTNVAGQAGFYTLVNLNAGDKIEVRLMGGTPGDTGSVIKTLYQETVVAADITLSSVVIHPDKNRVTVMMPQETYNGKNNVVLYINGKYIAQSYSGTRYYSYQPTNVAGQAGFYNLVKLNKGDQVEVRLMGGTPGANAGILKVLYKETVQ